MPNNVNPDTNQTPKTIHLPDASAQGVENVPNPNPPGEKPDEHVPPVEVPGRPQTPEHVPEKGNPKGHTHAGPTLVKG